MNKLTIVALCVCLGLAACADSSGSGSDPLSNAFKQVLAGKAGVEVLCRPICGAACKLVKDSCVNIEGLSDCGAQVAKCGQGCGHLCGCLDACPATCAEKCPGGDVFGNYLCQQRVAICVGICQARCPIDIFTEEIMASINKCLAGIQMLMQGENNMAVAAAP